MSLQRCKQETTSREFVEWKIWLQEEWNHRTKSDHYMARVCFLLHNLLAATVKSKDFKLLDEAECLLEFKFPSPDDPEQQPLTKEEAAAMAKSKWFGALGMNKDGTFQTRKPPNRKKPKRQNPSSEARRRAQELQKRKKPNA